MKKAILVIVAFFITLTFAGCQEGCVPSSRTSTTGTSESETTTTTNEGVPSSTSQTTYPSDLPQYVPGSIKIVPKEQLLADFNFEVLHYRNVYYEIEGFYSALVPHEEGLAFMEPYYQTNHEEPQEMILAAFIKYFNVPREEFDKATEKLINARISLGDDMTHEQWEIPNGDIIYTFDNDIINEYYRRE